MSLIESASVFTGEARGGLMWADGKMIKNEVDMQVCVAIHLCLSPEGIVYINIDILYLSCVLIL